MGLRNLASSLDMNINSRSDRNDTPDLVVHHSLAAISEHNNSDLIPGMFPTSFPFSIGGFEDKSQPTPLSFKEQAAYYFDISDKSFCYHYSYIFVVLNMLQC